MLSALEDLDIAYSHWKSTWAEPLDLSSKGNHSLGAVASTKINALSAACDQNSSFSFSDVVLEYVKRVAERTFAYSEVNPVLDQARQSLCHKRDDIESFIVFLEVNCITNLSEVCRLGILNILKALVGLQHLRRFHIQHDELYNVIVSKLAEKSHDSERDQQKELSLLLSSSLRGSPGLQSSRRADALAAGASSAEEEISLPSGRVQNAAILRFYEAISNSADFFTHLFEELMKKRKLFGSNTFAWAALVLDALKLADSYCKVTHEIEALYADHLGLSTLLTDLVEYEDNPARKSTKDSLYHAANNIVNRVQEEEVSSFSEDGDYSVSDSPFGAEYMFPGKSFFLIMANFATQLLEDVDFYLKKTLDLYDFNGEISGRNKIELKSATLIEDGNESMKSEPNKMYEICELSFSLCAHLLAIFHRDASLNNFLKKKKILLKSSWRDLLFSHCWRFEELATALTNFLNQTNGACGFEYTMELSLKYSHIPSIVRVAYWNTQNSNISAYSLNILWMEALESQEFCDKLFRYLLEDETFRFLLHRIPSDLTSCLMEKPEYRWLLFLSLARNASEEEIPDFFTRKSPGAMQMFTQFLERAFSDVMYAAEASGSFEKKTFYTGVAKLLVAADAATITNRSIAAQSTRLNGNQYKFPEESLIDDVSYNMLLLQLQARIPSLQTPEKQKQLLKADLVEEILKEVGSAKWTTKKEQRELRDLLIDISALLPRKITLGMREEAYEIFWRLTLEGDLPLYEKIFLIDSYNLSGKQISCPPDKKDYLLKKTLLFQLLEKYGAGVLQNKRGRDIYRIAEDIDRRLVTVIRRCLVIF